MANTVQLTKNGQPVYPITDVSLIIGLEDAIELPPVKVATLPTASAETAGKMYYVGPTNGEYERYITSAVNGSYEWIDLGDTSIPLPSIADNLTTDDSNMALSAKQGVVLDGKVSQLGQEVGDLDDQINGVSEVNYIDGKKVLIDGTLQDDANSITTDFLPCTDTDYVYIGSNDFLPNGYFCVYDADFNKIDHWSPRIAVNLSLYSYSAEIAWCRVSYSKDDIDICNVIINNEEVWHPIAVQTNGIEQRVQELEETKLDEAPTDGQEYVRKSGDWAALNLYDITYSRDYGQVAKLLATTSLLEVPGLHRGDELYVRIRTNESKDVSMYQFISAEDREYPTPGSTSTNKWQKITITRDGNLGISFTLSLSESQSVVAEIVKRKDIDNLKRRVADLPYEELQPYYDAYLSEKVSSIETYLKTCASSCDIFFFTTDTHFDNGNQYGLEQSPLTAMNMEQCFPMMKMLSQQLKIDTLFHAGDIYNYPLFDKPYNPLKRYADAICSNKVYAALGNHEFISLKKQDEVSWYVRMINNDMVYGDDARTYGYIDNVGRKMRYIILSAFKASVDGVANYTENGYSDDAQFFWFTNTALNAPAGWTIVIITHELYTNIGNPETGTEWNWSIPQGQNGQRFIDAITGYSGGATIACVLMGHSHHDGMKIVDGIPFIISQTDRVLIPTEPSLVDNFVTRERGTITEQHFEVVVINKKEKKVRLFAIGSKSLNGFDGEEGDEVEYREVPYDAE